MQIRPLMQPGAFGPEVIAAMGEALEAALKELQHTGPTDVVREIVAGRIIGAARLGERDPARLRAAALGGGQLRPPGPIRDRRPQPVGTAGGSADTFDRGAAPTPATPAPRPGGAPVHHQNEATQHRLDVDDD
jgi:hypothetical protein